MLHTKEAGSAPRATWPPATGGEALTEASRQLHSAVLWLARLAHTYCDAETGNAHLLLGWDDRRAAIVTPEIARRTVVELRLPWFFLHFCEAGIPTPHPVMLDEKSPAEVEAWCLIELLHRNLDRDRFSKDLPFPVEGLMKGDGEHFDHESHAEKFEALTGWLHHAAEVLGSLGGGKPRIRPSSMALLTTLPAGGEAGFCADANADAPYFYAAAADGETRRIPIGQIVDEAMTPEDVAKALGAPAGRAS